MAEAEMHYSHRRYYPHREGAVEDYLKWVTGETTEEKNPRGFNRGDIDLLRAAQAEPNGTVYGMIANELFADQGGTYYDISDEMRQAEQEMKEKQGMVTKATERKSTTKVLDGDEIKLNADPKDRTIHVPQGETYEGVMNTLELARADQEKVIKFSRVFNYRPHDGAFAVHNVLKRIYGVAVAKKVVVEDPFGPMEIEPELITIKTGPNKTETIPWGALAIPALNGAILRLEAERSKFGPVFKIQVETKKVNKPDIDALFEAIDVELKTNSIYRGKALVGAFDLEFLDVSKFDPNRLAFSDHVTNALEATIFNRLRNMDTLKKVGLPTKTSVLLYGPFGTGKSSIGKWIAQIAEQNGWTFLQARTGQDRVEDVLQTANLYQRAVVFVEDLGEQASALNSSDKISSMLETFDGITSKDSEVIMVMTTNHVENIHKGMLRPGRIDLALEIAGLDRNGTERLFRAVIDAKRLDQNTDFDAVYDHMKEWEPAWVRAVADRAQLWAIQRANGSLNYKIGTEDLLGAARSLEPQLELLRAASEGERVPTADQALREVFEGALHGIGIVDSDGDDTYQYLSVAEGNRLELKR